MNRVSLTIVALGAMTPAQQLLATQRCERPNIAWYITEDTSPQYIAHFNDGRGAKMPNLERFAKEAVTFTNAFSNAPVSSAARTTLLTSCYAPRFGGALHRHIERFPLPEGVDMFPQHLAANGYFTTNAKKDDYNVEFDENSVWQRPKAMSSDWRERENQDQPFFYMTTNVVTHEGRLLFKESAYQSKETETDPKDVYIPESFPDTDLMRYTFATFYDKLAASDAEFGSMLNNLEEDGLMENTIIFFFGDNGGTTPGTKGYTTDCGLRVPLLVYVPEQWRKELGVEAGTTCDDIVSFMDFGATVLKLAGVEQPKGIDGTPFLGKGHKENKSVVCYGDRFDELYAFSRVLYRGDYRYARNYTPYHPKGIYTFYRYRSLAFQEWASLYAAGKLSDKQAAFYEPQGAEELYDLKRDPEELVNLAKDPQYRKIAESMRKELDATTTKRLDLGFYPETILLEDALSDPEQFGKDHSDDIKRYCDLANLQLNPYRESKSGVIGAINSQDIIDQWWGLTAAAWFGKSLEKEIINSIREVVNGNSRSLIRSRAVIALANAGERVDMSCVKAIVQSSHSLAESVLILNDLAYLKSAGLIAPFELDPSTTPFSKESLVAERILYLAQ
ncbi:MAG: sulfatase [Rikenellaceae bacterium]